MFARIDSATRLLDQKLKRLTETTPLSSPEQIARNLRTNVNELQSHFDSSIRTLRRAEEEHSEPSPIASKADMADIKALLQNQNVLLQRLTAFGADPQIPTNNDHAQSAKDMCCSRESGANIHNTDVARLRTAILTVIQTLQAKVDELLIRLILLLPLFRHYARILRSIPAGVSMLLSDNIQFEDALGRHAFLPFEHFRHFPVFIARLLYHFRDIPGECRILDNQYRLFRGRCGGSLLTETNWSTMVQPGTKVYMAIVAGDLCRLQDYCFRCFKGVLIKRNKNLFAWLVSS